VRSLFLVFVALLLDGIYGYLLPNLPLQSLVQNGYALQPVQDPIAKLDVFLGPFCEDSRRAFPTFAELASKLPRVELRLHLFPLPYNYGSFLAAQACVSAGLVVNHTIVPRCLQLIYTGDTQKTVKTHALFNYTAPQVITELVDLISSGLGVDKQALTAQMQQGLESGAGSYSLTKSDYKYGTTLGVYATPAVFVNNVQIFGYDAKGATVGTDHAEGALADMTVADWKAFLRPVVENNS